MSLRTRGSFPAALAAAALLAFLQLSCATMSPDPVSMPAARAGLRPQYRVFYDELTDYGDWVLIEPFGFVFRPRTRFSTWSPYFDGFWSPSDNYGWVWVSAEPYGWATYHYGRWVNDDYQGWVWIPGLDWAPAWVAWSGNDQFVGWAPLGPSGGLNTLAPGANYNYVARSDLGSTDLRSKVLAPAQAAKVESTAPIQNLGEVDRVVVNRGPRIEWIEAAAGPLPRARVQDAAPMGRARPSDPGTGGAVSEPSPPPAPTNEFKRSAEADARRTRTIMQQKQAQPDVIQRFTTPPTSTAPSAPKQKSAPPAKQPPAPRDTLR